MDKETGTQRFHQRMDDIARRLQEETEVTETLTHHFNTAIQRNQKEEVRSRELENQLEIAQQQLKEQKGGAEGLIQQIAAELEESRSQMSGAEARMQKLEQELGVANGKPEEKRKAAERLIMQLETERDESRSQMNEVEERMRELERQMGAAHEQFRRQRETAVNTIRQMAAERDESRSQVSEVEDRMQKLEEELAAAQEGLRAEKKSGDSPADPQAAVLPDGQQVRYWQAVAPLTLMLVSVDLLAMSVQSNPALLEIVRDIQPQCQNLLELLRRDESL